MAMTFTTLKNTNQETVIHFASSAAESGTITINTLAAATQELIVGGTPVVDIVKWSVSGALDSKVTVTRNAKLVIAGAPENAPYLEFNTWGVPLNIENTSDIVVTNGAATDVTGILVLRKQAGWATKVEESTYGAYDDRTRVGASTTLSGSPDKV
jgi:hypothetical protein